MQDLFASTYSSFQAVPGWQTGPPRAMGFSMQYNTAVVPLHTKDYYIYNFAQQVTHNCVYLMVSAHAKFCAVEVDKPIRCQK